MLVLALVAAGLVAVGPSADAAPVFARATLDTRGGVYTESNDCATEDTASPDVEDLEIPENGPAVTAQRSSHASTTYTPNPDDVMTSSSSVTGTGRISSVGADLGRLDFDARATASLAPSSASSACRVWSSTDVQMGAEFVVTRGGFLTVMLSSRGDVYTSVSLGTEGDKRRARSYKDFYFSTDGEGGKVDSTATFYLPPGEYYARLESAVDIDGRTVQSLSGTGSVHATFAVAGSQTVAAAGKGQRYVTFPATRSCDTHSLAPSITGKGKRAKRIKRVVFLVNDRVVKKLRTPDRGETVLVPVADEQGGQVRAVVKLFPTRRGKPGKVVELSGAYAPCS